MLLRLMLGAALAAVVAGAACRGNALSRSGAIAAVAVGAAAVAAGWAWGILLFCFFATSSALTAYKATYKRQLTEGMLGNSGRRDAFQVLANGSVFALAAAAWIASDALVWIAAGAGAIAAAAADSWATEIGIAFGGRPRSIVSLRPAQRGASGGITAAGTLGGIGGAAAMGGIVLIIGWGSSVAAAAVLAGTIGMVIDSLLGASAQARRLCTACSTDTEQAVHHCGTPTRVVRGVRWMDNDMVNALTTLSGAAISALVFHVIA